MNSKRLIISYKPQMFYLVKQVPLFLNPSLNNRSCNVEDFLNKTKALITYTTCSEIPMPSDTSPQK